jgi:hypothetical protein
MIVAVAHRLGVARALAVVLIVLILLPFTAPFPTCELGSRQHGSPCDLQANDQPVSDDAVFESLRPSPSLLPVRLLPELPRQFVNAAVLQRAPVLRL